MTAAGVFDDVALPVAVDPREDPDAAAAMLDATDAHRASLAALAWTDASRLSAAGRVDRLVAVRRHIAMLQAWQTDAVAEFAAERDGDEFAAMEVTPALLVSQRSASTRMTEAAYVTTVLPETLALQARGEISEEAKHTAARDERRVTRSPGPDDMAELWAFLPAEDSEKVYRAIEHTASALYPADDPRTADQRRADALVAIADAVLAGHLPDVGSAATDTTPVVPIPASTLFGDDVPGHLTGHGPITPAHARTLAVAAAAEHWRIAVTDDHGNLLVRCAGTYRIPDALKEHIRLRDRYCTFPNCTTRAERCDTDHLDPWPHGATHHHNLHALCRRHHRLKYRAPGWTVTRDPATGTITWTSPTGHVYRVEPPEQPNGP